MELEEPTSNNSNISNDNSDSDEYEEEVSYIIIDLGTEVTLDMITNNFEILNNINPSSFNFNQNRNHQNQDHLSSSTSILQQSSSSDLHDNINNKTNDATASTSATRTTNHSQKSFHYYIKPLANNEKESVGDEPSNFNNKKENNDIDYSLIGLDTDTPYLRIGNIHFKGEYDETIGTDLIFFPEPDPINPRQQKLTYQCQTTKKIKFSQVNLQEINLDKTSELNQFNIDDDNEWENKYSISKKKFSLDDQELFNIKSNLHDNSDDDENDGNESNNQNDTVIVNKGKRKEIINQEQNIEISNVETRKEEDTMEID
ncbi:hypothetical protein RhiirA5_497691 [Rhizophagus irregularis]|uniref:Transcription factor TFIIIC triple barrel domain-containing protein n=4 Tax=Rhizophagus irregularis TaxID=588596 RepID=A0A2N0RUN2_9GLOM|nr:hypothetical protein GLOIN_2v1765295 [Rhizophagus irregularis DAOM 181602=DAOM 197198]EXX60104.1 hypothetical protein RirG_182950 [Rhizophagus irregularis DAOM 197198w]PKC11442.1 hypothetical protein RhiirA5_497691 [Rhizophagus irregularis]PKC67005.1 hypothetical protein RhiirA1_535217 [Rhizophagus irregularis]POG79644.1 hypothetical protein GLOIN_2v1765295 [Rhizophagus irregularis DAOM 181602=DAOM 197198]UZO29792.1 hypothetical protein OCT59_023250 [Rhizophagus irregularis]|eukprot:XP_025186510.1 hypothetical protein GLOIN_2v1765295 [Rhizophagus irregularis DAOM 181602=DAOM 197198]